MKTWSLQILITERFVSAKKLDPFNKIQISKVNWKLQNNQKGLK